MPAVNKSAFRQPLRRQRERFALPEYGDDAYVVLQALTSRDIVALQNAYGQTPDSDNLDFVYELFHRALVDDEGRLLFESAADVAAHLNLSLPVLEHLVESCLHVSGIQSARKEEKN